MPPQPFYGNSYDDIKPKFSNANANANPNPNPNSPSGRIILPKALPALPKPVIITSFIPGDVPETDNLMHLDAVKGNGGSPTGKGHCAVIIDSGLYEHRLLIKSIAGRLTVNAEAGVNDNYGHGTHMAGIISGREEYSGMAIAPDSKILSIKVTDYVGGSASWSSIYKALNKVKRIVDGDESFSADFEDRISVVNLSFNGLDTLIPNAIRNYHKILNVIHDLYDRDIPVVISGGNYYEEREGSGLGYPACDEYAIHTGAIFNWDFIGYPLGSIAKFSQRNLAKKEASTTDHDIKKNSNNFIFAPASVSVSLSTSSNYRKQYSYLSGSSISAAIVTGCILLMQEEHQKKTGTIMSVNAIKAALINESDVFTNRKLNDRMRSRPDRFFDNHKYCKINIENSLKSI